MDELKNQDELLNRYIKITEVLKAVLVPIINFFVFYVINFVVQFCFSFMFAVLTANSRLSVEEQLANVEKMFNKNVSLMYIVIAVLYLGIYITVQKKTKFSNIINLEYKKTTFPIGVFSASLGMFMGILSNVGLTLLSEKLPQSWVEGNRESVSSFQGGNVFVMLIAVVIFAPIVEELLFRGLIYNAIKKVFKVLIKSTTEKAKYFTVITAALITSFLFGIYHGNILQAIYAGVLSLFMIWVYEKSGSILASILIHSMFNFSGAPSYLMVVLLGEVGTIVAAVVTVCISVVMIHKLCPKEN